MKKVGVFLALVLIIYNICYADVLASWDVSGVDVADGTGIDESVSPYRFTSPSLANHISDAKLALSASVNPSTSTNQYGCKVSTADSKTNLADAISADHYIQISITVENNYYINFSSIEMNGQTTSTGWNNAAFMSEIAGYTSGNELYEVTNIAGNTGGLDTDASGWGSSIDLSGDNYQGITGTTTFRIYGWGSTDGAGVSYIRNLSGNDFVINGTIGTTLPVTLSTFTAQYLDSKPTLYWQTQSEEDNMGWLLYRNTLEDFASSEKVSDMIDGHGTTTQPQDYIYEDIDELQIAQTYYYWLESVDYGGTIHQYDMVVNITIPDTDDPNQNVTEPVAYDITSNPNPFSQTASITFALRQTGMVDVTIYNIKGEVVKSFDTVSANAEEDVSFEWNGKDNAGKSLSNGVYLYSIKINGKDYATKQLILMR